MSSIKRHNFLYYTCLSALLVLITTGRTQGQNLIRNHNFEEFSSFENFDFGYKELENNITTWNNPTQSGPRIYSDEKSAKSGKMFAGIHCYGRLNYREYISTPLTCRLVPGDTYIFRMYVKLSLNSEFAISSFGALLSKEKPRFNTQDRIIDTPQIFVEDIAFYTERRAWVLVEDTFVATGEESFLTIGNFNDDNNSVTKKVALMSREGMAYYYIDDVYILPLGGSDPCNLKSDTVDCNIQLSEYNLIHDPSFECYKTCPSDINTTELHQLQYWRQTGTGTPDYYNSCSIIMSTPKNVMGVQDPKHGDGYVGMYLYDQGNYREFLTTKLTRPLVKERWYVVKLWAAMSENSGYATDAFEFLITEKPLGLDKAQVDKLKKAKPDSAIFENMIHIDSLLYGSIKPQVINEPGNFADSYDWKMICGLYLAEGGEQYITLGNFNTDAETAKKLVTKGKGRYSYYFIEDFTLEPLNDNNMTDCGAGVPMEEEPELTTTRYFENLTMPQLLNDQPFTFKDFFFEFDKYDILDTNYYFLDSLIILLDENEDLNIEVQGHTDDVGSDEYNAELSKNRAVAVVNYLVSEGINKKRIKYTFYGAKKPVDTNTTAEGRQRNRRVEFVIRRSK